MRPRIVLVFALTSIACQPLLAQTPPASAPAPAVDLSGVLFGSFWLRTDSAAKAQTGGKPPNRFDLERAYLTFRMAAGERTNIRVTTDIFQNVATYYGGWVVRLKYGYVNRELAQALFGVQGLTAAARVGMLHTVVIDHIEAHWPRSLGTSALERNGFFSSADLGAAALVLLPGNRGEVYATLTNGPGYTSGETDRFKDAGARVSLTPFARRGSVLKTLVITPWYYRGAAASVFILGGPTQVGRVSEGLRRDRRGLFVALRDRKLTGGVELAQRIEGIESGSNTVTAPRLVTDRTSNLRSAFALVRPAEWLRSDRPSRLGVVARLDHFRLNTSTSAATRFTVLGAFWDLTPKTTLTVDWQSLEPLGGSTNVRTRTLFVHWKAEF